LTAPGDRTYHPVIPTGELMDAALLGSVPVAIIYSFFVDDYGAGLTAGSGKT